MASEWSSVMGPDSRFIWSLSGDLKYMLTMLGHSGASSSYPCLWCVRSRILMGYRSWIPDERTIMQAREPKAFHGDSQMRSYPAGDNCKHDVGAGTCFCVDKGATFIQDHLNKEFEGDAEIYRPTDQHAPFHDVVLKLAKENTYSIVAQPLLVDIPLKMRFGPAWHCPHNTRQMLWVMTKDACGVYGVLPALQKSLDKLGLGDVNVTSVYKQRKEANIEACITAENEAARQTIEDAEEKEKRSRRMGMNGKELVRVMAHLPLIGEEMMRDIKPADKVKCQRWLTIIQAAVTVFNEAVAILSADVWLSNRASEMGFKFRTFADQIANISKGCGLPYVSRAYIAILPIHWLCEPDHLEKFASDLYAMYGVAPGSLTDCTTEMVRPCFN